MPTLTEKIIKAHLQEGTMDRGCPIAIKIDQTLTQDATGTMAYLQLEAMGVDQVKTELSVSYVDHNTLQSGFENADDHKYLQTVANKHGIYFSRPGNGICHQVHLERFAAPGKTLLGSDSHTPTAGGIGALAIGAGGLDVACAMAGRPFNLKMPKVVNVKLTGALHKGVSSKDIILKVLQLMTVKGGVGKVIEYTGEGVKTLNIPQRATITNMGAELGATTSIFPSDEVTYEFLKKQNREDCFVALSADDDAVYDETYEINLDDLEPMIAMPHSPDAVKSISEVVGKKIDQVAIGSCTNSSYRDMMIVASILKNKTVAENVSLCISPGSKQVLTMLSQNGALTDLISSGARMLECTCGPCIGMGQSPITNAWSLRTFNRNFYGRSGTLSANVCLVSPEVAAYSAIKGVISDPREAEFDIPAEPDHFLVDDSMIIAPEKQHPENVEIVRGPNIKPLPENTPLADTVEKQVVIKVVDNITTDHIAPAGAKVLPFRSNIEKISEFIFRDVQAGFKQHCLSVGGGFIVDEEHFGQQDSAPVEVPYPYSSAADLQKHCQETGLSLSGLMMKNELALHSKEELEQHLANVWEVMRGGIESGISTEGVLPGKLRVPRRAAALRRMLVSQDKTTTDPMAVVDWINMFALAVNEENAAGGRVVTAPTNGACGIIPAVLAYYDKFIREVNANSLARYLLVASAIGSLYKMNASISGAEVGCQGEVGVACSMAAAGLAELLGASPAQVCIAAEIAMEHNLGLTCDPVAGQVQVPCIERNAIAAVKAVNAARMALRRTSEPRVCLDKVIETMYETGKDMNAKYRETSRGGLAMKIVACD